MPVLKKTLLLQHRLELSATGMALKHDDDFSRPHLELEFAGMPGRNHLLRDRDRRGFGQVEDEASGRDRFTP